MIYVAHIAGIMLLILLQTVVVNQTFLQGSFYDLFCPFIIFLSIFRPWRETLPVVIAAGLSMDSFSGGPPGLYITAYFWVWLTMRLLIGWLYAGNPMILLFIVSLGVVLENAIILLLVLLLKPGDMQLIIILKTMFNHFLWAVLTGPSLLLLIKLFYDRWEGWYSRMRSEEQQHLN